MFEARCLEMMYVKTRSGTAARHHTQPELQETAGIGEPTW